MRTWHRSHYNAWLLYGHSHGRLPPIGKSWDVGVDNNNFTPISFEQVKDIMKARPDNPNLVKRG
jgi:calcineurin-like phosphoesterase family protein